jgi:peptidoglycan/LPS O-acetylase OafA/YrhL
VPSREAIPPAAAPAGAGDGRRFRPEIEGLRAVAALLVAVYHVFIGRVSGGVDVFFVVAGFLITLTLLGHLDRSGRVVVGSYLSRLAARLVPLAFFVLLVVLVASVAWLPVTRLDAVLKEIAASAVYMENWQLARKSVDYLAQGQAMSPVQHFWALSIQGQFYLIWLAVFTVAGLLARRARRGVRPVLAVILGLLVAASLAFSVHLTSVNQPFAYFHTGARVWEFAAGGLLALALPAAALALRRIPAVVGVAAGWLGLAMIVTCGILIPVSTSFPGWVALWPITGGLLVIAAGDAPGAGSRWSTTRLLGSRPFVFLGGVSYAIYLWHWPLLTFYRSRAGEGPADLLPGLVLIGVAVGLAILTTRFVERPVRTRLVPRLPAWRTAMAGALALGVLAVTSFGYTRVMPMPASAAVALGTDDYPGAAAMVPGFVYRGGDVPFAPGVLEAADDLPVVYRNGCHQRLAGEDGAGTDGAADLARALADRSCSFGDRRSATTVVLVGGSHAMQWFPALREIAERREWHLVSLTKSGCRFTAGPQGANDQDRSCESWNEAALEAITGMRPALVVTTSTVTRPSGESVEDGALAHWRALEQAGIPVLGIRDNPRWPANPLDCLALHPEDPGACSTERAFSMSAVDPTTLLGDPPPNVTFADLTPFLCTGEACPAVIGNVVVNYDAQHLSASYARTLAPMLEERLPAVGPDPS